MAADISDGSSYPRDLTVFDGKLYFTADDGVNGDELWSFHPAGGAVMVSDITPGYPSSPRGLTVFNNRLYFSAYENPHGRKLWSFSSTDGMSLPVDLQGAPLKLASASHDLRKVGARLYFSASDGVNGWELWFIDRSGLAQMVADIWPGSGNGVPHEYL